VQSILCSKKTDLPVRQTRWTKKSSISRNKQGQDTAIFKRVGINGDNTNAMTIAHD
jgi:hypothetical protein